MTGEQHLHIAHNIYKRRLDLSGKPIEDPKKTGIYIVIKIYLFSIFVIYPFLIISYSDIAEIKKSTEKVYHDIILNLIFFYKVNILNVRLKPASR
jgi:hypothetical protein